jgi:hypothetical protein
MKNTERHRAVLGTGPSSQTNTCFSRSKKNTTETTHRLVHTKEATLRPKLAPKNATSGSESVGKPIALL